MGGMPKLPGQDFLAPGMSNLPGMGGDGAQHDFQGMGNRFTEQDMQDRFDLRQGNMQGLKGRMGDLRGRMAGLDPEADADRMAKMQERMGGMKDRMGKRRGKQQELKQAMAGLPPQQVHRQQQMDDQWTQVPRQPWTP